MNELTEQETKRIKELEDKAARNFLGDSRHRLIMWIEDEAEQKEYCELYNKRHDTKKCICNTHLDWEV